MLPLFTVRGETHGTFGSRTWLLVDWDSTACYWPSALPAVLGPGDFNPNASRVNPGTKP
jgi:hypothetical protein